MALINVYGPPIEQPQNVVDKPDLDGGGTQDGIELKRVAHVCIERAKIEHCRTGIRLLSALMCSVDHRFSILECRRAIEVDTLDGAPHSNHNRIGPGSIGSCGREGLFAVKVDGCNGTVLEGVDIENCGQSGNPNSGALYIGGNSPEMGNVTSHTVRDCWLEQNKGNALVARCKHLALDNCTIVTNFRTDGDRKSHVLTFSGDTLLVRNLRAGGGAEGDVIRLENVKTARFEGCRVDTPRFEVVGPKPQVSVFGSSFTATDVVGP